MLTPLFLYQIIVYSFWRDCFQLSWAFKLYDPLVGLIGLVAVVMLVLGWSFCRHFKQKRKYSEFLEFAVSLRTAELEDRKAAWKASNEELEQFLFAASHDLKQPTRTILNFSKLLLDGKSAQLDEEAKLYLQFIASSGQRLHDLIDDMVTYSEIGSNSRKEWIDTKKLVEEVVQDLSDSMSTAKVKVSGLPELEAYPVELSSLFENLISNALKYRREEVTPSISISCIDNEHEWLFSVADNGKGFDPEYEDKIFGLFKRLENALEIDGTGIGLAQCKKIVELHEGDIWAETKPGIGSTFFFTIPQVNPPHQ